MNGWEACSSFNLRYFEVFNSGLMSGEFNLDALLAGLLKAYNLLVKLTWGCKFDVSYNLDACFVRW